MCYRYLDYEAEYPAQPKEVRKHLFKLLHRALQVDTESRARLAVMGLSSPQEKKEMREMVAHLGDVMHARGDAWTLQGCTLLPSSWYNRHRTVCP